MVWHGEPESPFESGANPTDDALAGFAAAARLDEAVSARRRERWLRQQASEETTFHGTCWSLAEAGRTVVVTTRSGRTRVGRLRVVGEDFVSLQDARRHEHLLPLASVNTLAATSTGWSGPDAPTGRPRRPGVRMSEALASLAGDRPLVQVTCEGRAAVLTGELTGAGSDVLVLDPGAGPNGGPQPAVYVRLSSVAELSLMASG
jgi:hypothetical protein